jgi:hypothetical protein
LHIGAVKRIHSTFTFEFFVEIYKPDIVLKPWDSTTEMANIPADKTRVL